MNIITVKGDLVKNIESFPKSILVHGVNAQGVMGKGIAKQIKDTYKVVYDSYKNKYVSQNNFLELGDIIPVNITSDIIICNAVTQEYYAKSYKDNTVFVDYNAIEKSFKSINDLAVSKGYESIHFPKIGCGLANGDWNLVQSIISKSCPNIDKIYWEFKK